MHSSSRKDLICLSRVLKVRRILSFEKEVEMKYFFNEYLRVEKSFSIVAFTFVEFVDSTWVKYMWWVYIIGFIWISEFITSCQSMVIAGAVAHWYFR